MMKKKKLLLISLAASTMILAGCSATTVSQDMHNTFNDISQESNSNIVIDGKNIPNLANQFKNKEFKNNYFMISHPMTLKTALQELSNIDGRQYYLQQNMENILIPATEIKLYSFQDLKNYIEDVMEKTIFISKNAVLMNRTKVVEIMDIRQKQNNLKNIPFVLNSSMSVKDALKELSLNKDFDFSVSLDNDDFENEKDKKIFEDVYLNYKGSDVESFFKYLERKLNIFIVVDYKNKIVSFKKYNKSTFALLIPNLKMTIDSSEADTEVTADAGKTISSVKEKKELDTYKKIIESFDKIKNESIARGNKNTYYILDEQTGTVVIHADKKTLSTFSELINKTNDAYKDMIEVEILTFELVYSQSYEYQTKFNIIDKKIGTFSSPVEVAKAVFNNNPDSLENKSSFLFSSLQKFGYVADKTVNKFTLRNHIPDSDTILETERYLKNIVNINPANLGDTTKQTTETDIVKQPNSYNLTAHYKDGRISIDLKTSKGTLTHMGTIGEGDYMVSNPQTKSTDMTEHIYMKNGESFITASKLSTKKIADFNGVIPTEWLAANILGGGESNDIVHTQTITIVSAKKINNL